MKLNRNLIKLVFASLALGTAALAFAINVRGSSGNGEDSNAANWMLLGRSITLTLTANARKL